MERSGRGGAVVARALAFVLAVALSASTAGRAEGAPKLLAEAWARVETPNLVVYGDGSRASVRGLASDLETFRAIALALLPTARPVEGEKVVVIALRDGWSLRKYGLDGEVAAGRSIGLGWAVIRPGRAWILMVSPSKKASRNIGFHEYAHYLTARSTPFLPPWLREGLAEYWGTLQIERDGTLQLGGPNHGRLKSLKRGFWQPFEAVLAARTLHGSGTVTAAMYAEAWVFAQYAAHVEPGLTRALPDYLERVYGGEEHAAAFEAAFGRSPADLQEQLEAYVHRDRFAAIRFKVGGLQRGHELAVRRATRAEIGTELGMLHVAARRRPELAAELFDRVIERDPENGRALAGQAVLGGDGLSPADREALFDRAMAAAPDDPLVFALAARHAFHAAESDPRGPDGRWDRAAELLRRTLEVGPAELHSAFLQARVALRIDAELEGPTAALERALQLRPDRGPGTAMLQALYLRQGRYDDAWLLHTALIAPMRLPERTEESLERLVGAEAERLAELAAQGRGDERAARCGEVLARPQEIWRVALADLCSPPVAP